MDVYSELCFYITVSKVRKVDLHVPKHQALGEVSNVPRKIGHIKHERYS